MADVYNIQKSKIGLIRVTLEPLDVSFLFEGGVGEYIIGGRFGVISARHQSI